MVNAHLPNRQLLPISWKTGVDLLSKLANSSSGPVGRTAVVLFFDIQLYIKRPPVADEMDKEVIRMGRIINHFSMVFYRIQGKIVSLPCIRLYLNTLSSDQ